MTPTIGRNDPCHCGSGKKYKKCHLEKDEKADRKKREKEALNMAKTAAKEQEKEAMMAEMAKLPAWKRWLHPLKRLFGLTKKPPA